MASQEDPSEPLRLPDSFASAGDPVDGNPFLHDDPLHAVWGDATRKAEETVCRLTADALSTQTSGTTAWATTLIIAKFDAWAQRGLCGVWCDRAAQHYDQWLVVYANSWIDEVARTYAATSPSPSVDILLNDLRRQLGAKVHVWKAAARRVRADQQSTTSSPRVGGPAPGGSPSCDTGLGENPYPEHDPDHHEWTKTSRILGDVLARVDSAFVSASPRAADAATVVDWVATWTVGYFDAMAKARMMLIVQNKGDAGRETYRGVLDRLREQALRALNNLLADVSRHAQTLMAAFPGVTASNVDCLNFAAAVNNQIVPEVTTRLFRRKVHWWLQASIMAREHDNQEVARNEATSVTSTGVMEAAPEAVAVPERRAGVITARGLPVGVCCYVPGTIRGADECA